jgi:hypothetical protein
MTFDAKGRCHATSRFELTAVALAVLNGERTQ